RLRAASASPENPMKPRLAPAILVATLLAGCGAAGEVPAGAESAAAGNALPLGRIQGEGERSPFEGQRVEVQGIVTANFVDGLDGFFLQDAVGEDDGDRDTSDAVFVHWPRGSTPKVRRGDRVRVAGTVLEREQGGGSQTVLEAVEVAPL